MNESTVEKAALAWFESIGYHTAAGAEISPGGGRPLRETYESAFLEQRVRSALQKINDHLPEEAIEQAVRVVTRPPEPTLTQNNRWFHNLLTDGIDVERRTAEGELRGDKAWLLDAVNVNRNDLLVVSQLAIQAGNSTRRPDLVVFVNGLPIAVLELKDPSDEQADLWSAYHQLQDYKQHVPTLFYCNEILAISDGNSTRIGSVTASSDRFSPWRSMEDYRIPGASHIEVLIKELFDPAQLVDYLRHCVAFEENERTGEIVKRIAGYHQFRAVRNSRASIKAALRPPTGSGEGRGGVVWHTQGSGKSLTMLMLAGAVITDLDNPTVVVVTDRNDLDNQLFDTFAAGRALLRHQSPEQAEDRDDLTQKLNRASGGVIFTTIQKFTERSGAISQRQNIIVMADEAHRSQYGFVEGGARWMREALPNATFVGFTGTPLERDDRSTSGVFGGYSDIYDIRQAIDDNATVPIYYEMRLVKLLPNEQGISEAETQVAMAAEADREGVTAPPSIEVPLEELVGTPDRLQTVAEEIVDHLEERRSVIEGKAMVVSA